MLSQALRQHKTGWLINDVFFPHRDGYRYIKELMDTPGKGIHSHYLYTGTPESAMARIMADPVMKAEYEHVLRTPAFQRELGDTALESVKTADVVKRPLDDRIERLQARGADNEVRILTEAKNEFLRLVDQASPTYLVRRRSNPLKTQP